MWQFRSAQTSRSSDAGAGLVHCTGGIDCQGEPQEVVQRVRQALVGQLVPDSAALWHGNDHPATTQAGEVIRDVLPRRSELDGQISWVGRLLTQRQQKVHADRIGQYVPEAGQNVGVSHHRRRHRIKLCDRLVWFSSRFGLSGADGGRQKMLRVRLYACHHVRMSAYEASGDAGPAVNDPYVEMAVEIFALLADATRARIVLALREGELSVGDIAATVGKSQTAVSQHLAKLRISKVVTTRQDGARVYYRLANDHALELIRVAVYQAEHAVDEPVLRHHHSGSQD